MMKREKHQRLSKSAATGTVALIFLILGFQLALFVVKVVERPSREEAPLQIVAAADSTYSAPPENSGSSGATANATPGSRRRAAPRKSPLGGYEAPEKPSYSQKRSHPRKVESFPFDPNTVTVDDLQRLGLSESQAEVIRRYRNKGGRFTRKEDFRKMYVVSDSLYERLEPFIDIAKVELNAADSASLVSLPGIGPWYAARIMEYRDALGGFYAPEQLLEVRGMDEDRFAPLKDRICVDTSAIRPLRLDILPEDSLARHPYIGRSRARSIVRFLKVYKGRSLAVEDLRRENVLDQASFERLRPYLELPSEAPKDVETVPDGQDEALESFVGDHLVVESADALRLDVTLTGPNLPVPEYVVRDDITAAPDFVAQQMQVFAVLLLGRVDIYQVVNLIQCGNDLAGIAENQPDAPFEACACKSFADEVFKLVVDLDRVEPSARRKPAGQADGRIAGKRAELEDAGWLHHAGECLQQAAGLRAREHAGIIGPQMRLTLQPCKRVADG